VVCGSLAASEWKNKEPDENGYAVLTPSTSQFAEWKLSFSK